MTQEGPVLVVAAHPDDEVLGCGGTMARLAREGCAVHVGILGEGVTSRHARREDAETEQLEALREDSRRAAEILGAQPPRFGGLPDNRFDTVPLLSVVKIVESWIGELHPRAVYTQHGGDLNIDHAVTFRAVLTAARPLPASAVKAVYAYPVLSSSEWAFGRFAPVFTPNIFVDIAATLEAKLEAMRAYGGELREFPHPRSLEALRAAARHWGSTAGLAAAEPFELLRELL